MYTESGVHRTEVLPSLKSRSSGPALGSHDGRKEVTVHRSISADDTHVMMVPPWPVR